MTYPVQMLKPVNTAAYEDKQYNIQGTNTQPFIWARGACYYRYGGYVTVIVCKDPTNPTRPYGLCEFADPARRELKMNNFARYKDIASILRTTRRDSLEQQILSGLLEAPEVVQNPRQLDTLDL